MKNQGSKIIKTLPIWFRGSLLLNKLINGKTFESDDNQSKIDTSLYEKRVSKFQE